MARITISLSDDYLEQAHEFANRRENGNLSSFFRSLLNKELLDHDISTCSKCGKVEYTGDDTSPVYTCEECELN